jgi:hypothetical protein
MKLSHLRILSVDWDYAFVNTDDFDWGHSEDNPLFYDVLWATRAGSVGLFSKKRALDVVHPEERLNGFWERTLDGYPMFLAVCDSHKSLYEWLKANNATQADVVNFDAHHDFGYGQRKSLDCGTWARLAMDEGLIQSYRVVYPPWRDQDSESAPAPKVPKACKIERSTELPAKGAYDTVFICRSSCWTPSWCDDKWLAFISHFEKWPWLWDAKCFMPYVLTERKCNMAEAQRSAKEWEKARIQLMAARA